jgi:hypothetical protein
MALTLELGISKLLSNTSLRSVFCPVTFHADQRQKIAKYILDMPEISEIKSKFFKVIPLFLRKKSK